jgi:hypothetical protein
MEYSLEQDHLSIKAPVRGLAAPRAFTGEVSNQVSSDGDVPFSCPVEAVSLAKAALVYLAAADPAAMPAETQAECLLGLERATAMVTAAHARILGVFAASRGHRADGAYSPSVTSSSHRLQLACSAPRRAVVP